MRVAFALIGMLLAAGCKPLLMPTPVHFNETAAVLDEGHTAVAFQAGGGASPLQGGAAGGSARIRRGVADGHEVGAEGALLYVGASNSNTASGANTNYGGAAGALKGTYKARLSQNAALLAGAGFTGSPTGNALGGDLGVVLSTRPGKWVPYTGARASLVKRLSASDPVGYSGAVVVPAGVQLHLGNGVGLSAEAGLSLFVGDGYEKDHKRVQSGGAIYGSVGVTFELGR